MTSLSTPVPRPVRLRPALSLLVAAMVLACLPAVAADADAGAAGGAGPGRQGWSYGLQVGWSLAKATGEDDANGVTLESDWVDDLVGGLRLGRAARDDLIWGLEAVVWGEEAAPFDLTAFWVLGTVTWFPAAGGAFVRGGAGLGGLSLEYDAIGPDDVSRTEGGLGLGVGAGYEWRFDGQLAVNAAWDLHWLDVGAVSYLSGLRTTVHSLTLGLTWYVGAATE